ncbi:MAG: GNAT family N-acetyltransferase [Microbacteriaceae bacterium]
MLPVQLFGSRILLDQPKRSDVAVITRVCQDPIFEQTMVIPWPYQQSDADYFVDRFVPEGWESEEELTWAIRLQGDIEQSLIGVVGFRMQAEAKNIDLGYWLSGTARGNGYLPEAVHTVMDWIPTSPFAEYTSYSWQAIAGNVSSARVAQKCGFHYLGVSPATLYREEHLTTVAGIQQAPDAWFGSRALLASEHDLLLAEESWASLSEHRINYS